MSFLEVRHVQKIYTTRFGGTKVQALTDVNFTVEKGEYVAIMGESGSGKTTLLNILAALDKPTGGEVVLDGRPLSTIPEREIAAFRRSQLGFVFQEFNLLDTFSVQDNIFLPLVLVRLIGGEATFGLNIRLMSIGYTVVFFGALFLLLLLNTIRIIHLSNPVQLLRAGSEGERDAQQVDPRTARRGVPCRGLSHFPAHKRGLVRHPEFLPGGHPCHHRHVSHVYRAERRRAQGAAQKPALLL